MEEEKRKYNPKAIMGTVIFHGLLLIVFVLFGLTTPLPLPEEQGVMVNLGYTDQGRGSRQPLTSAPPPQAPQQQQSTRPADDVATQQSDESVAIPDTRPQRPRQQTTNPTPTRPQPEVTQPEPEPEPQPTVDPRAMFPGRDRQSTTNQSQGDGSTAGNQGRPDGSQDGAGTVGGGQSGVEYSLAGRRGNSLPKPEYNSASQGKVVVSIIVNRNGQVVRATTAGVRGSTTTDRALHDAAIRAALQARFDAKSDAAEEQSGTITYNFIRLN